MSELAADVTICIPAWNAAAFIDRTLRCARMQTHHAVRIVVSIDFCADGTASVCEAHAREDSRIDVFAQPERLGWARNVNFLLDQVRTPFFFLYFHDDVIDRRYTERLRMTLIERPDAASAHCDMGHFGVNDHVSFGRDYDGAVTKRLAELLVVPERGSPLRSMTRAMSGGAELRMPVDAVSGLWANEPYLMRLIAAGPALRVPEILYLRWDQRSGGLTDGWKGLAVDEIISGFRANIATALSIIDSTAASRAELEVLAFCLYVNVMPRVRTAEIEHKVAQPVPADAIHRRFADLSVPSALAEFGEDIERWTLIRREQLADLERSLGIT